ncbi:hypothetical protein CVIRNUC_003822 [Coccomyxa viridis]|uniref:Rubredoxin-like domain-containing protein n=1 Tax=Coccomyxa viridis TaxID=1274662 RepID=A0AAV1I0W7_9CHLO|nr:hypothetical protein CVIRNUC_003822 [Coccomyxa viridis]
MEASASMATQPHSSAQALRLPSRLLSVKPGSASVRSFTQLPKSKRLKGNRGNCAPKTQALFGTKAPATGQQYLCIDCGYIYDGRVPFQDLGKDYRCPVCNAPKRRFKAQPRSQKSNGKSGIGSSRQPQAASGDGLGADDSSKLVAGGVGILVVVGAVYAFLNSQF